MQGLRAIRADGVTQSMAELRASARKVHLMLDLMFASVPEMLRALALSRVVDYIAFGVFGFWALKMLSAGKIPWTPRWVTRALKSSMLFEVWASCAKTWGL